MSKHLSEIVRMALLFIFFMPCLALAEKFTIEIQSEEEKDSSVEIIAKTNIPGSIEVMGGISLKGQADDDVYIGKSKKFLIIKGSGQVTIDTSDIPSGVYEAEVSFYPRWGFKDEASRSTGIDSSIETSKTINIEGSGESSDLAKTREEGQRWVMLNVITGTSWSKGDWISRFGTWETIPTETRNSRVIKNYYFKSIDMTIVVNILKDEVVTWGKGKDGL